MVRSQKLKKGKHMNSTTLAIIARLPKKPIIAPADIAAAYGKATTDAIIADIKTGNETRV